MTRVLGRPPRTTPALLRLHPAPLRQHFSLRSAKVPISTCMITADSDLYSGESSNSSGFFYAALQKMFSLQTLKLMSGVTTLCSNLILNFPPCKIVYLYLFVHLLHVWPCWKLAHLSQWVITFCVFTSFPCFSPLFLVNTKRRAVLSIDGHHRWKQRREEN